MRRLAFAVLAATLCAYAGDPARQRQNLTDLKSLLTPSNPKASARINAQDKTWEEWQARTGELPPDFDSMPSRPFLPDPLDGVRTREQWAERRKEIRAQFEHWVTGKMPPAPGNLRAKILSSRKEGEVTVRDVLLEFGPEHRAYLHVQLVIPPGKGPFPVFLTNHPRSRPWIAPAVRRGYIGCIFFATDPMYGAPDDSDKFVEVYPEYDFSALTRWAWAGMRAVDYLVSLPEVDKKKIAISGHSRNGKAALIAAAMDERIAAAIPSSGNTGEGNPWRYTSDPYVNETIEQITSTFPGWFHPRLRFFAGREHKLPVDQNELLSLIAPRGLLLFSAYSESQGNPFGFEQNYRSVKRVYDFLGASGKVGLTLRAGEHPTTAEDIEQFVDFLDSVFDRSTQPVPETFVLGYNWENWRSLSKENIDPKSLRIARTGEGKADIRRRIQWLLGDEPAAVPFPARATFEGRPMTSDGWLGGLYNRPLKGDAFRAAAIGFGDDLKGDLYVPAQHSSGKMPVVIWLHPYSYSTGYSQYAKQTINALTQRGFAVFAFDQVGFGTRIHQAKRFYERYPHWSLLGKMVSDTRAAVAAMAALQDVDAQHIFLAGYSLGGKVALLTAAMDDGVAGVIASSAFTPLRQTSPDTEGLREYSHLHGLAPRLGFFIGQESRIPVDYDEVLSAIAPRPLLVRAPQLDRYAVPDQVRAAVETARKAYGTAQDRLEFAAPLDFARFGPAAQESAFDWLLRWTR